MTAASQSIRRTLEQLRYWAAYTFAQQAKNNTSMDFSRYVVLVKKFPAMINTNGLGQALAYLAAKKGGAEQLLLQQLGDWLTRSEFNRDCDHYVPPYGEGGLLANIRDKDSRTYRRATVEALALLNYLRLAASGLDTKPEGA